MSEISKDPNKRLDAAYWIKKLEAKKAPKVPVKRGRKPIPVEQKKQLVSVYLTAEEKELIDKAYGNVTEAIRKIILPQLK